MPRIPQAHLGSVAIIYAGTTAVGTGFLLQLDRRLEGGGLSYYLVSCVHCIGGDDGDADSARLSDGTPLTFDAADWEDAPSDADLSVLDVTDLLSNPASLQFIRYGEFVYNPSTQYGVGSDLYMLGLYDDDSPLARFGNISSFAARPMTGLGPAEHLADMRSRAGFSGAPVFAYELRSAYGGLNAASALMGVHRGELEETIFATPDTPVTDWLRVEVPSSLTGIVPAWELEFIETNSKFELARIARLEKNKA